MDPIRTFLLDINVIAYSKAKSIHSSLKLWTFPTLRRKTQA